MKELNEVIYKAIIVTDFKCIPYLLAWAPGALIWFWVLEERLFKGGAH